MELQTGSCFICRNSNVIKSSQSQKAYKIISLLLPKEVLNPTEFDKVQSTLRVCPICYHKLIIMKRASKHLHKDIPKEVSGKHCPLCNSEKNLFQINNWPNFSAISEGTDFTKNKNCVICSDCLFYLETKNELKTKLFSKYPHLKIKTLNSNKNKRQWKLKFTPKIKLKSAPLSERKKRKKVLKKAEGLDTIVVESRDDELVTKTNINLKSLKKFKPLKDHKLFKNHKIVKTDSKFFNQIPYVLVNLANTNMDTFSQGREIKCTDKEENENIKIQNENKISVKSGVKLKNKINKNANKKHLTIQVSRMNINTYLKRYELNTENTNTQNINDKLCRSSNQTEESTYNDTDNSLREIQDNVEIETSFETKNKRKSVSFADDKNIEIEYFENKSNTKSRNHNSDEDSELISKRHSKGILKHEENNEEQITDASENHNKKLSKDTELLNKSCSEEVKNSEQNSQNQEYETVEASKTEIQNRRNSYMIDESNLSDISDPNSDIENLSEMIKKSIVENTDFSDDEIVLQDENTIHKEEITSKEHVVKPLSKMECRNTYSVDQPDDEFIAGGDNPEKSDPENHKEESEDKTKPNVEDDNKLASEDKGVEICDEKRESPKHLSKKKKINSDKSEDVDKDNSSGQLDIGKDTDPGNASGKLKRYKPKPLSKKKLDEKYQTTEDLNSKPDENLIDSEKEESNTRIQSHKVSDLDTNCQLENDSQVEDTSEAAKEEKENVSVEKEQPSLEDKSVEEDLNAMEVSKEVLEGNETENRIDKDSESFIDSNKSDNTCESDVTLLVNKYLNNQEEDGNSFLNTQKDDANEVTLNSSKDSEETKTEDDKVGGGKMNCNPVEPIADFDKNDELGISEVDNDNITSILSHMFPSELPNDGLLEPKSPNTNEIESEEDMGRDLKRKMVDDELNTSKEKKKKRVTFCDDVT